MKYLEGGQCLRHNEILYFSVFVFVFAFLCLFNLIIILFLIYTQQQQFQNVENNRWLIRTYN